VRIPRRRFTVDEYHRMGGCGCLTEGRRVELLDGEIVQMSPIGPPHASTVATADTLLVRRFGKQRDDLGAEPDHLDRWSEPQTGSLRAARTRGFLRQRAHPRPRDVLLGIEVMDTSRSYDRALKLPLYAKAELREVWLVDLKAAGHRGPPRPALRGYRAPETYARGR
jgi:Uma2 family endonuclease